MASCCRKAKNAEGEIKKGPNWLELPNDVTQNILQRLSVVEIVTSVSLVCSLWWNICKEPFMWRTIHMTKRPTSRSLYDLGKIFKYAIDRSCGLVEDINIQYFVNDDLLEYIAKCTSCVRRFRLAKDWSGISNKGISKIAKKLPLLEELDFSEILILNETLETFGRHCPLLKSFKLHNGLDFLYAPDDDAFAIAKTMSGLHHLKISRKRLKDVDVLAILDGCPLLESLDLGNCFTFDLSESVVKRCHEQIKDLQLQSFNDGNHGISDSDDDLSDDSTDSSESEDIS